MKHQYPYPHSNGNSRNRTDKPQRNLPCFSFRHGPEVPFPDSLLDLIQQAIRRILFIAV
jgi:hypothetical protein